MIVKGFDIEAIAEITKFDVDTINQLEKEAICNSE